MAMRREDRGGTAAGLVVGLALAIAALLGLGAVAADAADAPTRHAFVLGMQRYADRNIQSLTRSDNDAADVASDLEQLGFDKKNVTLATDLVAKADFQKRFDAFLATVKEGDVVFFFYSGHGLGIEATATDYLLLGGLKSLYSYTRDQMLPADRGNDQIIALKEPTFEGAYETDEIAKNGVSVSDVIDAINQKRPKIAVIVLDACRALAQSTTDEKEVKRGPDSGSRLLPAKDLPPGAIVMFSASFGEQAIESFGFNDHRRNSLFTEALRSEMQRPGQTLIELGQRVSLVVRAYATKGGAQQEPEFFENLGVDNKFALVDSVGGERFPLAQQQCDGAQADWNEISQQPEREALERHRKRFPDCPTAELARRALVNLLASAQQSGPAPTVGGKPIDDCDRLAASDTDPARPPEAPGVALENIDFDAATTACEQSIQRNSRVPRFLYNLGRAQEAAANSMRPDDPSRQPRLDAARAAFRDAADRGYVAALYSLATLFDYAETKDKDQDRANTMLKEAANQGYPPAMYELGVRYREGKLGVQRDLHEAYEWLAKAAESGFTPAMSDVANALWFGQGVDSNPRRAVEWAERAADAGFDTAKLNLGIYYLWGRQLWKQGQAAPDSVSHDHGQALLWFGRAAADNNSAAQYYLAQMMEFGLGLPNPQPETAERYYRLAAHGGDEDAEIELVRRLRSGRILVKPENGAGEAIDLLKRALSHGSARAAQLLAETYRNGEFDQARDPVLAMKYAFEAIKLSTQADPTTNDGDPYFEIDAGILLAEMAVAGQAADANDRPLLAQDEVDRLQRYYGTVDSATRRVKVRKLDVPLGCGSWRRTESVWVWDWGRAESPTEPQFRSLERKTSCYDNDVLRRTFIASFDAARKAKVPFADLILQQIAAAKAQEDARQRTRN